MKSLSLPSDLYLFIAKKTKELVKLLNFSKNSMTVLLNIIIVVKFLTTFKKKKKDILLSFQCF